ncbi:hypothetical protein [Terricaulis sp.]|uniref:hypothetical protein n=1 Tax=Terricaulis sp. TaxID=2768686 RepID=UPI003782F1FC
MYKPGHQFFVALAHATRAARRGDIALAERWLRVAERHTVLSERLRKFAAEDEASRARRPAWLKS